MRSRTNAGMESLYKRKTLNYSSHLAALYGTMYPDNRKKHRRNKLFDHGTKGCFVGYVSSSTYSYYNFSRKTILQSHNLTFMETEFPQRSDFGDFPDQAFKPLPGPNPKRSHDEDDESAMDPDSEDEHDEHTVAPFTPATPATPA